ncbi:MAG: endonuclease/exonuclease/phosphatase family protein [Coriobacteriales bacterium]|nr:endonuclease/exonuclease/phosphatase family protein [Coriobacteriales bacterium]
MRVVTWNVRFRELESRLAEIVGCLVDSGAEIVALQEVSNPLVDAMSDLLFQTGFEHCIDSFAHAPAGRWGRMPFASMVASKHPIKLGPNDWRLEAPYPESFARGIVYTPDGPLDVTSVHIPNGSAAGWKKVACMRALHSTLAEDADCPRIVAGDFNEPKELLANGSIVTFSGIEPEGRPRGHKLWTDHDGQTGDLCEWEEAVQSVLGLDASHGFEDAHRAVNGGMFMPTTHIAPGRVGRWFDHVLVSKELKVRACGVYSDWRENGYSDHAAVWAEVG